jgi:hypothetical protein
VTAARDSELQIIAMYTALASVAGPQQPAYVRLLDLHRQHLHALVDAQMTPVVEGVATAKAASALVAASVAPLQSAAVAAVSGQRAALLASIAASHVAQGSNATTPGRVS